MFFVSQVGTARVSGWRRLVIVSSPDEPTISTLSSWPPADAGGSAFAAAHANFQISATIIEQTAPAANSKWRDLRDMRRMSDLTAFVINGTFGTIGKVKK